MSESLERIIVSCIERQTSLRYILYPLSLLFQAGVILRNKAYDRGWLSQKRIPNQVISIGNIVAGGTGKTPFLMLLLKAVAKGTVLTRGYRTADEPRMIVNRLPHIGVRIGKNRIKGAVGAEGPIFLDDGMQYRKLHRDIEIVVMNGEDLFGKGYFLPRGFLRDSPERLARADYIILNHVDRQAQFDELEKQIRRYSAAPIIGTSFVLRRCYEGQKVALFCGIGSPATFIKAVEKGGGQVVNTLILPDHVAPTKKELKEFSLVSKEKGAERLLCTEKDWVKLETPLESHLDIECAYGEMEVIYGESEFEALMRKIV
ncbi:MAG: tetraacyldisaccharide 4'-kinase [Simkaniaceae bacterium]|nr:tetraacyldisaccharide 4'-kinase [Simkaniaceae bacterium]